MAKGVVQVRGTPTCGKSILSKLLRSYAEQALPDHVTVYVTWQLFGGSRRRGLEWLEFLCSWSKGRIQPEDFAESRNIIYIINKAQLSYADEMFWMECIKTYKGGNMGGPFFILFSSYRSGSNIVFEIEGSAPVDLNPGQQVPLIPQPNWPHGITFCFTVEELEEMCQKSARIRGATVSADVVLHLFTPTNGHPGLCDALPSNMLNREANSPP